MKLSTKTLQDLVNLIPRHIRGRQDPILFPVSRFNAIARELEKYCDVAYLTNEAIIPFEDNITDYAIPTNVRQIRGLYPVESGEVTPLKTAPQRYEELNNYIRLSTLPVVADDAVNITGTVPAASGSTVTTLIDTGNSELGDGDDNDLRSRGIILTRSSGIIDYMIIVNNDTDAFSLRVNGDFSAAPVTGDTYRIVSAYNMMQFAMYLPTLTLPTESLDMPQDFETVFELGLHWKYLVQQNENEREIVNMQRLYEQAKTRFCSDQNRFRGDNKIVEPRRIPNPFSFNDQ